MLVMNCPSHFAVLNSARTLRPLSFGVSVKRHSEELFNEPLTATIAKQFTYIFVCCCVKSPSGGGRVYSSGLQWSMHPDVAEDVVYSAEKSNPSRVVIKVQIIF